ncbi:U4/U6 small nuclear ribonucleoprotein PRP3 [Cryptococcus bacillisporus CA1873]|uniref:U4/U6 small nuclear ribonucleoprotein PRP3 n=1 Tax=Cryptococcus bacillisporus CA1873 TaxID=1296111 RepID=A0ABR5BG77_CRYGA|nr:U4/U6 small nuclear ribonucleoprotein PRP3 [Cryptococcus bacillisporus CA1873]|eukprot:KIR67823.1 U4/U6 small nuclear ribonucleoprotein PRP3 [Cryptococcus gattii CA1873]
MATDAQQPTAQTERNEKRAMRDRYKTMAPKFTSVRANVSVAAQTPAVAAAAPVLNPYAPGSATHSPAPDEERAPARKSKKLQFSRAGKYVEQGDQLRNEQKMEALRQRIADASRKAGLDSEFDTLERSLKRQPPPAVEWWDEAILPNGITYEDDLEAAYTALSTSSDSLITHLVLHPIPIPAPMDRRQPERGLMLTKKEQKKMRRQRRQAELEDKRDRQKMGLLPPDPPKVRLANLMKVLTSDAVQDPTKVEAKVRKEVAMRAHKHEKDNQERKLTAEERREKEYNQMVAKERNGIRGAVFKIKYLTNGRHKFKVRETAKANLLSGICIFHPSFALVMVEGIDKSIKHFKRLMLSRIDWTEQARPMADADGDGDASASDQDSGMNNNNNGKEGEQDLADNKCELIWEGELPERVFKMFRARHVETDSKAKEWLTPRFEGMWDLAKRWQWAGEEF